METIPIASLSPSIEASESKAIHGVVTLIWPYSSSTRRAAFLLAEPDFRLRRRKGQVKIQLSGASAQAVATSRIGIADEVTLGLVGARWIEVGGNGESVRTPGQSVEWELGYGQRIAIQIKRDGEDFASLDINESSPSPEHTTRSPVPTPLSPPSVKTPAPATTNGVENPKRWTSPAFFRHSRLSQNSLADSPYDPFVEEDGYVEGKGRKRRRKSWKDVYVWTYAERTPSPDEDQAETMSVDEEDERSHPAEPRTDQGNGELPQSPISAAAVGAESHPVLSGTSEDGGIEDLQQALGDPWRDLPRNHVDTLERATDVATHPHPTSVISLQSTDNEEQPELEKPEIPQHVATAQPQLHEPGSAKESNFSRDIKPDFEEDSSTQKELKHQAAITDSKSEDENVAIERHDENIGKELDDGARESIISLSETEKETPDQASHAKMDTDPKTTNEMDEEGGMERVTQGPESTVSVPAATSSLLSTVMPPPALPPLRTTGTAFDQGTNESQFTSAQDETPSSPVLHPIASATLPLPSPFPGEAGGAVSSYFDYSPSSKLAEHESPTTLHGVQAIQQTESDNQIRLSSPPAERPEDLHSEQMSPPAGSPMNERFSERFPFGLDGASMSQEAEGQPLVTSPQLDQNRSYQGSTLRERTPSTIEVPEGGFLSLDNQRHAQLSRASQATDISTTLVNLDTKPPDSEVSDIFSSESSSEETEDETESDQEDVTESGEEDEVDSWGNAYAREEVDDYESSYISEETVSDLEGEEVSPVSPSDQESESPEEDPEDYESYYDTDVSDHEQSAQEIAHEAESTRPAPMLAPEAESASFVRRSFEEYTKSDVNGTVLTARTTEIIDLGSETSEDDEEMPDLAKRMGSPKHTLKEMEQPPAIANKEENELPVTVESPANLDQDQPPKSLDGRSLTAAGHSEDAGSSMVKDLPESAVVGDVSIEPMNVDSNPDSMAWQHFSDMEDIVTIPPQSVKSAEDHPHATVPEEHAIVHAHMVTEDETHSTGSQRLAETFPFGRDHESTEVLDLTYDEPSHSSSMLPLYSANNEPAIDLLHLRSSQLFQEVIRDSEDGSVSSAVSLSTMDDTNNAESAVEPQNSVSEATEVQEVPAVDDSLVRERVDDLEHALPSRMSISNAEIVNEIISSDNFESGQAAELVSSNRALDVSHEHYLANDSQPLPIIVAGSLSIAQSSPPPGANPEAETETLRGDFTFADYLNDEFAYPRLPNVLKEQSPDVALDLQDQQDHVGDQLSNLNSNLPITPDPSQQVAYEPHYVHTEGQANSALPPTPSLTQMAVPDSIPEEGGNSFQPHPLLDDKKDDRSAVRVKKKSLTARLSHVPEVISEWFAPRRSSQILPSSVESGSESDEDEVVDGETIPTAKPIENGTISGAQLRSSPPASSSSVINALQSQSQRQSEPERPTLGFRTPLSYYTPLTQLSSHLNLPPPINLVDILAVVVRETRPPSRATSGPKDYYTIFSITDPGSWPARSQVQVFRPWKAAIPVAAKGDVVLLRGFGVKSRRGKAGLLSAEESAWCVWRFGGTSDEELAGDTTRPIWARKQEHGEARDLKAKEEVKGPPVEIGEEEREEVKRLREWWMDVCKENSGSGDAVEETQDFEESQVMRDMDEG